jgi:hypothetical protein
LITTATTYWKQSQKDECKNHSAKKHYLALIVVLNPINSEIKSVWQLTVNVFWKVTIAVLHDESMGGYEMNPVQANAPTQK